MKKIARLFIPLTVLACALFGAAASARQTPAGQQTPPAPPRQTPTPAPPQREEVEGQITVVPESFKIDQFTPGAKIARNIIVKSSTPFHVIQVNNTLGQFAVRSGPDDKAVQMLSITFTAPLTVSTRTSPLTLVTLMSPEIDFRATAAPGGTEIT